MAYSIRYGFRKGRRRGNRGRLFLWSLAFFALFLLIAWQVMPQQMSQLQQILLPQSELDKLLQDLRAGDSLGEAVGAFCQEIFHDK